MKDLNLHIYPSTLKHETRILKIARSLIEAGVFHQVEIVGKWEDGLCEVEQISDQIKLRRIRPKFRNVNGLIGRLLRVLSWYWAAYRYIQDKPFACINAHSLAVLPLCSFASWMHKRKLVYDTHELETEVLASRGLLRVALKITERLFIRSADAVCVVNKEIASWYARTYRLPAPWIVQNAPPERHSEPMVPTGLLRKQLSIPDNELVFLYQGLLSNGRGIEILINAFRNLPTDRHLVFMGYGPLEDRIIQASREQGNVHFHMAVSPDDLPRYTCDADVGLALIENKCVSYWLCLPNKLLEYNASGVPVVASDFPVIRRVVNQLQTGWLISPSEENVRSVLATLSPADIRAQKRLLSENTQGLSWEREEIALLEMYKSLGLVSC